MKIIRKTLLPLLLAIFLLASCSNLTPLATPAPTAILAATRVSPTATLDLMLPSPIPPTPDPNINIITAPNPDQQVYLDPDGRYSVNFPADLRPSSQPNYFSSERGDATFETGYLPEMGYVLHATFVCAWLANVELKPEESIKLPGSQNQVCSAATKDADGENIEYSVFENPGADPGHRFVYVKTQYYPEISGRLQTVFSWLKPVSKNRPESGLLPLSPQEAAFWQDTAPMPPGVSVTEYTLEPGAPSPYESGLFGFLPIDGLATARAEPTSAPTPRKTRIEQLPGYTDKYVKGDTRGECSQCRNQIYRNGRLLFDYVLHESEVFQFSTAAGPITAFWVDTQGGTFLVQNDAVLPWDHNQDSDVYKFFRPILYQDQLLWMRDQVTAAAHRAQVLTSDRKVVFSFVPYYADPISFHYHPTGINFFTSWQGHWILSFGNFLVQDGEIINKKLGYQEIFAWTLIHNKPAYFFGKGSRFGLSYDGQVLPLQYEDIAHALCCQDDGYGPSQNNARIVGDTAHFYGKRDGVWYYVEVKFK